MGARAAALCVSVVLVSYPLTAEAQSASKIVERHLEVIGGKKALDYDRTAEGSTVRVERTLVNDDVWMPASIEVNRRLKFAFGKSGQFFNTTRYTDYKKFSVATNTTIALPDPPR